MLPEMKTPRPNPLALRADGETDSARRYASGELEHGAGANCGSRGACHDPGGQLVATLFAASSRERLQRTQRFPGDSTLASMTLNQCILTSGGARWTRESGNDIRYGAHDGADTEERA